MWVSKRIISIVMAVLVTVSLVALGGYAVVSTVVGFQSGTIVIDAGHGGLDGGVSHGELLEKELTLDISFRVKKALEAAGYKVVMTRTDDAALAEGKKADMQARKKIIENARPDMVISVHINKFTASYRRGVQVFYDDTNKNREVGERMQSIMNTYINSEYSGKNKLEALGGDYFITKCSKYPTVIVECGFISNSDDRILMKSDEYKNALASAMVKGVQSLQGNTV